MPAGEDRDMMAEPAPPKRTTRRKAPTRRDEDARLASSATRLVGQAISVLEKEVSAGIAAARSLEERYADVDALRNRNPDDLMQRLREDAHEVVDLVIDLLHIAASSAGGLAQRVVRVRARSGDGDEVAESSIPAIESMAARPGERATVSMALENAGTETVEAVNFIASDLVTSTGLRIAASDIQFEPAEVTIGPRARAQVRISVQVPQDAAPGTYSGMLVASKLEQVRAVLSIPVAQAPSAE